MSQVEVTEGAPVEQPASARMLSTLELRAEELHREDHPYAAASSTVWCPTIDECVHTGHDRAMYLLYAHATLTHEG